MRSGAGLSEPGPNTLTLTLILTPNTNPPPSPPDYVLDPYTPDPQPALNATLPLYITLY